MDLTGPIMEARAFPPLRSRGGSAFRMLWRSAPCEARPGARGGVSGGAPVNEHPQQLASRVKLQARGISKTYGASMVLKPLELKVFAGELLAVLGPSGSGKTTLLQIICGLVEPSSGRLVIDGNDETDNPADKRDIGVVFQ